MSIRHLRWLGVAALIIGYALLAHYTSASLHNGNLGALVSIAPILGIVLALAWRSVLRASLRRSLRIGLVCLFALGCAAGGVGLWLSWPLLVQHFGAMYWIQHAGMQLILFMTFGRTLLNGQKPLCTRFAQAVHTPYAPLTPLAPPHEKYTRHVTTAWTLFFAVMALMSTLLFFLTPLTVWSVFANFLTLPLVALMFIAEYAVRKQVLPDEQHGHILDAVRAYWKPPAPPQVGQL